MKRLLKILFRKFGIELTRADTNNKDFISLQPDGVNRGSVLLSYTINPFILKGEMQFDIRHTCDWECWQMARTFLDFGFSVDVINWDNYKFKPEKHYSVVIDELKNLERITALINNDCIKIMHIVWAHWLFNNGAQYERLLKLQQRKGTVLMPRRILEPNFGIETADYATMLGNQFTEGTYSYAQKPVFHLPVTTPVLYSWPEDKDFDTFRKNYLWFGSGGLVHKGLDLVLDAFATMPEYHLTICGPIQQEKDFECVYYKELYQTPNIHTVGWVNVSTPEFVEITNKCVGLIYPSCSEGQSGAVVTCLQAGLIPIVSYESGVDVNDFGVILKDCSTNEIKNSLRMLSSLPAEELKLMSRKAWEFARANHTRERFAQEYRKVVDQIMTAHYNKNELVENENSALLTRTLARNR